MDIASCRIPIGNAIGFLPLRQRICFWPHVASGQTRTQHNPFPRLGTTCLPPWALCTYVILSVVHAILNSPSSSLPITHCLPSYSVISLLPGKAGGLSDIRLQRGGEEEMEKRGRTEDNALQISPLVASRTTWIVLFNYVVDVT